MIDRLKDIIAKAKYLTLTIADQGDQVQITADGDGRILAGLHQDVGYHGRGGGLAVGSGYGHTVLIVVHQLAQELRTGQHRDIMGQCVGVLRIVLEDGGRIDHEGDVRVVLHILFGMLRVDRDPLLPQIVAVFGRNRVRTGHREAFLVQETCQTAHAGPADPDKMYVLFPVKIDMLHIFPLYLSV